MQLCMYLVEAGRPSVPEFPVTSNFGDSFMQLHFDIWEASIACADIEIELTTLTRSNGLIQRQKKKLFDSSIPIE